MAQTKQEKLDILAALPPGVFRIQVVDETGKTKYKKPDAVSDTDQIVLSDTGAPVVMTSKPGRPQKTEIAPANDVVAELIRQKQESLTDDPLLNIIEDNPEKSDVLDYVMRGLAEEAASLSFERRDAERKGQPTSQISMRRIGALKAVGDSWLKRKEQIVANSVDMDSPAFKRLFQYILDTFQESMEVSGLRAEMIETIFASLTKHLDEEDWAREATKRMLGD